MYRDCARCRRAFIPADLVKEESKDMEGFRKVLSLEGVRFLYYSCPKCGENEVFVDIHPLPGEDQGGFDRRREDAETLVLELHGNKVDTVFTRRPCNTTIAGKRAQLAGLLQETYGYDQEQAEEAREFSTALAEATEQQEDQFGTTAMADESSTEADDYKVSEDDDYTAAPRRRAQGDKKGETNGTERWRRYP